jgi:hypothetical protein
MFESIKSKISTMLANDGPGSSPENPIIIRSTGSPPQEEFDGDILLRNLSKYEGRMVPIEEARHVLRDFPAAELASSGLSDERIRKVVFLATLTVELNASLNPEMAAEPQRYIERFAANMLRDRIEQNAKVSS